MKIRNLVAATALSASAFVTTGTLMESSPVSAHDACTNFPDSGPNYNFHRACSIHDWCYGSKPYGNNSYGRARCDSMFKTDMYDDCSWRSSWRGTSCRRTADSAYWTVRAAGWYFWD
ncbi:MAG: phospholipase A2 [Ilumatobacteraceae bacterium]